MFRTSTTSSDSALDKVWKTKTKKRKRRGGSRGSRKQRNNDPVESDSVGGPTCALKWVYVCIDSEGLEHGIGIPALQDGALEGYILRLHPEEGAIPTAIPRSSLNAKRREPQSSNRCRGTADDTTNLSYPDRKRSPRQPPVRTSGRAAYERQPSAPELISSASIPIFWQSRPPTITISRRPASGKLRAFSNTFAPYFAITTSYLSRIAIALHVGKVIANYPN
ncbi:hypothetical protein B0H65DRAFT_444374 [Neurospora tetraspora]|uniref:Uncharacterized protein n=1 Tax=Neurospora tetraspora TaxID=94610 RepID=A0AAE0MPB9_9PEZI|nr:hypothetical protein B0H65DRAFT_444374 [Neurospora tetraspora]